MSQPDIQLSSHFKLSELIQSQTALRRNLDNYPKDPAVIENLKALCIKVLEPVRVHYGKSITPSSGYRSPVVNGAVGGSKTSQHMTGEAVDFVVPGVPCDQVVQWIQKNLTYDQLILEYYNPAKGTGWVHCSYRRQGTNRKQFLRIGC